MQVLIPPHQYIGYEDGEFVVNDQYERELSRLPGPLYVVTCVGRYRTGKSFFLNRLFRTQEEGGFVLGRTIESATRGLWIWVQRLDGRTIILLDTEGLYVPKNSGMNFDNKILALSLLLSSLFILNTTGTIDRSSINQLEFVVELTKHIKTSTRRSGGGLDGLASYHEFFPNFMWLVRDFFLELRNDSGDYLTDNQYLEDVLKDTSGGADADDDEAGGGDGEMRKLNRTKEYIKRVFPRRQCFTLCQPVNDSSQLSRVHELAYGALEDRFTTKLDGIVENVLTSLPKKQMFSQPWSGKIFYTMTKSFVEHVNSDQFIIIDSSFSAVVSANNEKVVTSCRENYIKDMTSQVAENGDFPFEEHVLDAFHQAAYARHADVLKASCYDQQPDKTVADILDEWKLSIIRVDDITDHTDDDDDAVVVVGGVYFTEFVQPNVVASRRKCVRFLREQWKLLIDSCFDDLVRQVDGVDVYDEKCDDIKHAYFHEPNLGPLRQPVFDEFMDEKISEKIKLENMNAFVIDQLKKTRRLEQSLQTKQDELAQLAEQVEIDKNRIRKEKASMQDERDRIQQEFQQEKERFKEEQRLAASRQMDSQEKKDCCSIQ